MKSKNMLGLLLAAAVASLSLTAMPVRASGSCDDEPSDYSITNIVKFRPGAFVKIVSKVHVNDNAPESARTVLNLNGIVHTANIWDPLISSFDAYSGSGTKVRRTISMNWPGRGGSGFPYGSAGVLFGDIGTEDYVTILDKMLHEYDKLDIGPTTILAHSAAALVVDKLQDRLVEDDKSLRSKHGVRRRVNIGGASGSGVNDPFLNSTNGVYLAYGYSVTNAIYGGNVVSVDSFSFQLFFFGTYIDELGNLGPVANAPSPEEIVSAGLSADEPFAFTLHVLEVDANRPFVSPGVLAPCYGTTVASFMGEGDPFNSPAQQDSLGAYLTGNSSFHTTVIAGTNACHSLMYNMPNEVAAAIRSSL